MLKDPGNPRQKLGDNLTRSQLAHQGDLPSFWTQLPLSLNGVLRGGVLTVVSVILLVSVYYAFEVFRQLGQFIKDPASARQAVADIGDMIVADSLTLQLQGDAPLQLGPLIAFFLLIVLYLVWLYVPATLITVCGRILLAVAKDLPDLKSKKASSKS
ncbi:MAG: hypothetical protein GY768_29740 [Planctomycetaceae bacterium]|nr:hypothetical protein [Planctomycetaceae bacterium]